MFIIRSNMFSCEEPERKDRVVSPGKYQKHFDSQAVTGRSSHVLRSEEVRSKGLKMKTVQSKQGKVAKNGLLSQFNIRADPNIGVGKAAIQWILCPCTSYND
jgi:hypothetical protein